MLRNLRVMNSVAALAIVTAVATIGGVAISTQPTAAQQALPQFDMGVADVVTLDDQLLEVARQDPAFGGMFFDDQGRLTMYMHESVLEMQSGFGRLAGMSLSLESTFADNPMMAAAATQRVNVLPAQYSFADLHGWSEAMKSSVLGIPGVAAQPTSPKTEIAFASASKHRRSPSRCAISWSAWGFRQRPS